MCHKHRAVFMCFTFFCCFYFPPSWAPKKLIYLEMRDLPGEAWECLWLILWWEWQCLLQRLSSSQTAADEQTTAQINNMRKNAIYCKVLCDLEIFVLTVFCQTDVCWYQSEWCAVLVVCRIWKSLFPLHNGFWTSLLECFLHPRFFSYLYLQSTWLSNGVSEMLQ